MGDDGAAVTFFVFVPRRLGAQGYLSDYWSERNGFEAAAEATNKTHPAGERPEHSGKRENKSNPPSQIHQCAFLRAILLLLFHRLLPHFRLH